MEDLKRPWRKSSYSGNGGECVETANGDRSVMVRDTKLDRSPALTFSAHDWRRFTASIKNT
jgi:hypothetical protein